MNVQLAAKPDPTVLAHPQPAAGEVTMTRATPVRPPAIPPISVPTDDPHKWFAAAFFYFVSGWIILNSGWCTDAMGYPLMLVGLLLPLIPALVVRQQRQKAAGAQLALAAKQAQRRRNVGSKVVYELHSHECTAPL